MNVNLECPQDGHKKKNVSNGLDHCLCYLRIDEIMFRLLPVRRFQTVEGSFTFSALFFSDLWIFDRGLKNGFLEILDFGQNR